MAVWTLDPKEAAKAGLAMQVQGRDVVNIGITYSNALLSALMPSWTENVDVYWDWYDSVAMPIVIAQITKSNLALMKMFSAH